VLVSDYANSMQKIFLAISVLSIFSACGHDASTVFKKDNLTFKSYLYPSFIKTAEITVTKNDGKNKIQFVIMNHEIINRPADTFYQKNFLLSLNQFEKLDSEVIEKIKIKQPHQWEGCCDGMPVRYLLINGNDTASLHFRSPDIRSDSSGYNITKSMIDNFRLIITDTVINDYLEDIESYMDNSKKTYPCNR